MDRQGNALCSRFTGVGSGCHRTRPCIKVPASSFETRSLDVSHLAAPAAMSAWLADLVVVVHLLFILFVAAGALLLFRWPRLAWMHLPAAIWGVLVEWAGWICPLTPLENALRRAAGEAGYGGGFVERYLLPLIYPTGLTPAIQFALGAAVLVFNVAVYVIVYGVRRRG